MRMLSEPKRCPECGGSIPPEAPLGLCPRCLFRQASAPTEAGKSESLRAIAPALAELTAAFPNLELRELIGQGGMGFVYKARQPKLDRLVALKILPQSLATDPAFAERFTREARVLARLNHPNIVAIHDFGQAGDFFYLLMEFVDGVNLRQAMKAGRFTPAQALAVVPKICEALQYAHNEGVLHRDIKPENVLVDKKGRVRIADFGLAKILGREPKDLRLTGARDVVGTPNYMAPEQVEKPQQVDHRADIYSLGVVFYEMLTGELPLGRFAPPSQKVRVDVRLDEVVLHALEKEPQRRYQHASEVKTDVECIAQRPVPPSQPVPPAAPFHAAPRPEFWKTAVGVLAVLITLMLVGSLLLVAIPIVLPALLQAKARFTGASQPNLIVTGKVTDAVTGKPIVRARVSDNRYGAGTQRTPQEAWTDSTGTFQLKTWDEEHNIAASAPGYEPGTAIILTKVLRHTDSTEINFKLQPTGATRKLNDAVAELAALRQNYTEEHPLVRAKLTQVQQLRNDLGTAQPEAAPTPEPPPVVIRTVPESGATEVDPNLNELRATFSSPMKDGCWSWATWGEENFPEITGQIHYLPDGCTCVLPVKLKPGKVYATWLNSERFQNFQDRAGRPAVPYLLIFKTSSR